MADRENMDEKRKRIRGKILRAAWRLFRQYGYGKTTVGEVAAEAGIGKGTVYLYFDNKEDILVALAGETNRRILRKMGMIADSECPAATRIEEMALTRILEIFDIVHHSPHGGEMIGTHKPVIVRSLGWFFEEQERLFRQVLHSGNESGEFAMTVKSVDEEIASALSTFTEILTPPYYRIGSRDELESFARTMIRGFLAGVGKGN